MNMAAAKLAPPMAAIARYVFIDVRVPVAVATGTDVKADLIVTDRIN
jgi:hypothetical protein